MLMCMSALLHITHCLKLLRNENLIAIVVSNV